MHWECARVSIILSDESLLIKPGSKWSFTKTINTKTDHPTPAPHHTGQKPYLVILYLNISCQHSWDGKNSEDIAPGAVYTNSLLYFLKWKIEYFMKNDFLVLHNMIHWCCIEWWTLEQYLIEIRASHHPSPSYTKSVLKRCKVDLIHGSSLDGLDLIENVNWLLNICRWMELALDQLRLD